MFEQFDRCFAHGISRPRGAKCPACASGAKSLANIIFGDTIPPESPPNQHIREGDQYAYDIVTGDPYIDKAIARHRGSIPRPWWWRLRRWWRK